MFVRKGAMDYITLGIGLFALGYGVYSTYLRIKNPGKFSKLEAMKKFWGERAGTVIHFIAYTVVPIGAGIFFTVLGFLGIPIF